MKKCLESGNTGGEIEIPETSGRDAVGGGGRELSLSDRG